jgi:hypothetical protein
VTAASDRRQALRAARVRSTRAVRRAGPVVLPLLLAALAAAGWGVDPVALAVILALELAVAGLGMAAIGYARYALLAIATVSVTLAGRLLPAGIGPLAAPAAWAFLWWVIRIERRGPDAPTARLQLDLILVLTVFAGSLGLAELIPAELWLVELILLGAGAAIACLRAAEARGALGVAAVAHGALHLLVVLQVAAALTLLNVPQPVGPALIALTFHSWSGAADALESGVPVRAVALEYGSLAAVGVLVAVVLGQP